MKEFNVGQMYMDEDGEWQISEILNDGMLRVVNIEENSPDEGKVCLMSTEQLDRIIKEQDSYVYILQRKGYPEEQQFGVWHRTLHDALKWADKWNCGCRELDGDSDELIDTIVKVRKNGEKLEEIEMYYDFNPYTSMQSMEVRSKKMLFSDYESFKQKLIYDLKQQLTGTGIKVDIRTIPKINEVLDGITFQRTGDMAAPILYVEEAYKHYQSGQAYGQVLNDAMDFAFDEKNYETNFPKLTDDYVRRNLFLVLMNFQENKELLLHMPYERIADLAVVPKVEIITADPEEKVSFFMNYDMMDKCHLTAEETFRIAHENMEQKDYICQPLMDDMDIEEDPKIYVLTSDISVDGAAAIVSKKAMTEARKLIGEDFMILPSSRHEVILVPRSNPMSVKQMEDLVRDANRAVVAPKDRLSDHVYRYHSKDRSITKITAMKEQQKLTLDPNIIY